MGFWEGPTQVKELSQQGGIWTGCAVWDCSQQLADRAGHPAVLTFAVNMFFKVRCFSNHHDENLPSLTTACWPVPKQVL